MRALNAGTSRRGRRRSAGAGFACEFLESRTLLSITPVLPSPAAASPMFIASHPAKNAKPFSSATPPSTATTPLQMRHFYGVDNVNLLGIVGDGSGQTIGIVDVYD